MRATASHARPFISRIIQVQNRPNAPVNLQIEFPYDYVMQLGNFSPDGKYLAFLSDRSGKNEIWFKELENERYHQLTGNEDYQIESELTWSSDSKKIYFKSYLDNQFGIYYLEL